MFDKNLILVRGVSGAGKTTIARMLNTSARSIAFSTDDMFMERTVHPNHTGFSEKYVFDPSKLPEYHAKTVVKVCNAMKMDNVDLIIVHNTFTQEWEMSNYIAQAEEYGWTVHTIVVENRHDSKSIHDVPDHSINAQKERFEVVL
tara:strand:- start:372 stop:806 length:435 start_codon:yes stop_codon:yes gene_type:complete